LSLGLLLLRLLGGGVSTATAGRTARVLGISIGSGLLVGLHVLVLAVLAEATLSSVLEVAAHLLLAGGVLGLRNSVRGALVLCAMEESTPLAKSALFALSPVVAVALGGVITRGSVDESTSRMLVLAVAVEAAFAIVSESAADFLSFLALCAGCQLLDFVIRHVFG
jgi:hypothetical protein